MWKDLRGEIGEMFDRLVVCVDVHHDTKRGFELVNPNKRKELEKDRRKYKAEKQKAIDARKRAERDAGRVCKCGGKLGRPYRQQAMCLSCGAPTFVPSATKRAA